MSITEDLERVGCDLYPLRMWSWSEQPIVVLDEGRPWLYVPVERDPLMTARGHIALPRQQIKQLRILAALGVPFQRLVIAHELDPNGPAADLLPVLHDGPRTCTDAVARVLVGPQPAHPTLRRAARIADGLIGRAAVARVAEKILDPILFGVVGAPDLVNGCPALFYPLAAWRW